jgi:hypothetical protein
MPLDWEMEVGMTMYGGYTGGDGAARQQAASASSEAASAKRDVAELERELGRLKLVCAAVWELLKERGKLTEDDLAAKVAELDAKDGVADGQLTRSVRKCVKCQRTVPAKQSKCMYCGLEQPLTSVFEGI